MADSQPWLKTLRRFGSRLSLNNSRWSLSSDSDHRFWQARYDHRRASQADGDTDRYGYSTNSVELVLVNRNSEHEGSSQDVEDCTQQNQLSEEGEDRLAVCHESLNHEQDPLSSAVAVPDPVSIRRRPLPPLPPSQRADDGRLRDLSAQLAHLSHQGWYWGPLTLDETQVILADLPDGSYIVRDSHNDAYLLAIGLRADGRTVHTRISHCNGRFMFAHHRHGSARTIDELIRNGIFVRGKQRQLLYPVSRLMRMRSLKEYCRFALRRLIAIDRIDDLEIPVTLKAWLKKNPY